MDESHKFVPDDPAFAQGLNEGDIVMCWNDKPSDAVMRAFAGVVERRPMYADEHGTWQRFKYARPLEEYIDKAFRR